MSDPTPPRPDDIGRPDGGSGSGGPPSEFLTPVRPYETIEPGAAGPAGPSGRRMGVVVVAIVIVLALIVGIAVLTSGGNEGAPGTPGGFDAAVDLCDAPNCDRITVTADLSWQAPEGGEVTGYEVLRDGAQIDRVGAGATTYTVEHLDIDTTYTFGIQAVGPGGTGPATETTVDTPTPRLAEAQLDGQYRVELRVRSVRNLSTFLGIENPRLGSTSTSKWLFTATCDAEAGACPVRWFGRGPIPPKGNGYAGTFEDDAATCAGSGKTPVTATMDLTSSDAKAEPPRWLVQRFHGTLTIEFRCPGAGGVSRGTVEVDGRRT